ncbi:MAG: hypothetical protein DRN37_02065 [Thermoplasmata archaeon]|nr:MAG: hypothetical protein DRG82_05420 [Deltaproteobacteria bacterium]RLF60829.1 MAG: hypothetical protein DRN37_02065 [Thermoplasmata archaeon]
MDEGVDPTNVCQGVMEKLARSEQLRTVADPDILALFEDWLEELEEEVISFARKSASLHPEDLAEGLALSWSGAKFLLAKLRKEGKLQRSQEWEGL